MTRSTLSHAESSAFYDRFGATQDKQGWYENAALDEMILYADFESAHSLCEFGCGTGALAERLLTQSATGIDYYLALDSSSIMVQLANNRLEPLPATDVKLTDGAIHVPSPPTMFDRFVCCYVFDLLSESDAHLLLAEAARVLKPGGLLCVVSLSKGQTLTSKFVSTVWTLAYNISPSLVGGCRPISLRTMLRLEDWDIRDQRTVEPWGVPSEVIVAAYRG